VWLKGAYEQWNSAFLKVLIEQTLRGTRTESPLKRTEKPKVKTTILRVLYGDVRWGQSSLSASEKAVRDCLEKLLTATGLGKTTTCTCLVCIVQIAFVCVCRENNNLGGGKAGGDDTGCLNSVHDGHRDVHQHNVWSMLFDQCNSLRTILGFSN
jgi:hypothetical protein